MRNQEWDPAFANLCSLHLAELVFCLFACDSVDSEASLRVVDQTEILVRFLNGDDVHVTGGVGGVGSDFLIDFDESLHEDGLSLTIVERIFETVEGIKVRGVDHSGTSCYGFCATDRLRRNTIRGMQSRNLCGPGDARGA